MMKSLRVPQVTE